MTPLAMLKEKHEVSSARLLAVMASVLAIGIGLGMAFVKTECPPLGWFIVSAICIGLSGAICRHKGYLLGEKETTEDFNSRLFYNWRKHKEETEIWLNKGASAQLENKIQTQLNNP